jgi:hypothetical protein
MSCLPRSDATPDPQLMSILPSSAVIWASKLPDFSPSPVILLVSSPIRLPSPSFEPLKNPINVLA